VGIAARGVDSDEEDGEEWEQCPVERIGRRAEHSCLSRMGELQFTVPGG